MARACVLVFGIVLAGREWLVERAPWTPPRWGWGDDRGWSPAHDANDHHAHHHHGRGDDCPQHDDGSDDEGAGGGEPPSGPRVAGGFGDPHLTTFDGLAYDFQQVGEYVLSSNGSDCVVQARFAPFAGSSAGSSMQAVAANVGGDRVAYYLGANEPLLINGAPGLVPESGLALAYGGRVSRTEDGYALEWPAGENLRIRVGPTLDVQLTLPSGAAAHQGLLGAANGDPSDDLVARDGQAFALPVSHAVLHAAFGDSFRVTPAESLFDYPAETTTDTFADEAFPTHQLTARSLPTERYNAAHATCTAAGVSHPIVLEDCILDVAASGGDPALAHAAAAVPELPPGAIALGIEGYSQDFEGDDDGLWSIGGHALLPETSAFPATRVHGPTYTPEAVVVDLGGLPEHTSVTVAFDLHVLGAWEGESFEVLLWGYQNVSATSFSNGLAPQAFPGQLGEPDQPAQTAALAVDSVDVGLGEMPRAVYHHSYTFTHSDHSIEFWFLAPELAEGAGFAIDNFELTTGLLGDPWQARCAGGEALDDGNPCTRDSCDASGAAQHEPQPAGVACSDGDLCNGEETCDGAGQCVTTPLVLDDGNPCTVESCDPRLGVIRTPSAAGVACGDGDVCNGAESCDGLGSCVPGLPPLPGELPADTTCDGNDDDCDGAIDEDFQPECAGAGVTACVNAAVVELACDDADACTEDSCAWGSCAHAAITCDDGNACTADSCDPFAGCTAEVQVGAACDDGNACSDLALCSAAGACEPQSFIDPDDGNPCTTDSCDPLLGVRHEPASGTCDDGNACTTVDVCSAGVCVGQSPVRCSALDQCHAAGSCDPATGACSEPTLPDGTACALPASASAECSAGRCELLTCLPLFEDCDGSAANGCELPVGSDSQNCGACGVACPGGAPCVEGICQVPGDTPETAGETCWRILEQGGTWNGLYYIDPDGPDGLPPYQVLCDQTTDGGGWTVFQRRTSASDFFRTFAEYQAGFGAPDENHWIGNDRVAAFTAARQSELRVELGFDLERRYAKYAYFALGDSDSGYALDIAGYAGDGGDSLAYHDGASFSTKDFGNTNCANSQHGAWWYVNCQKSNLNGEYGSAAAGTGINWFTWKGNTTSLTFTELKMREVMPTSPLPGSSAEAPAASCLDVLHHHALPVDGVYYIDPDGVEGLPPYAVYCDQTSDGGGWIVFQRRISDSDFYRGWQEYEAGFGEADGNYWLGNARLAAISATGPHELRVDIGYRGNSYYALYTQFALAGPETFYRLSVGGYSGTAGNALTYHNNRPFSTYDADHDTYADNCAERFHGGWWYKNCHESNLNATYGSTVYGNGMIWLPITGQANSATLSEMKVRER